MPKRTDHNQKTIIAALREIGATVQSLHVLGRGCPDLLVGFRQKNYLIEVKSEHGRLTPAEECWLASWQGQAAVVQTVEEAFKAIGLTTE